MRLTADPPDMQIRYAESRESWTALTDFLGRYVLQLAGGGTRGAASCGRLVRGHLKLRVFGIRELSFRQTYVLRLLLLCSEISTSSTSVIHDTIDMFTFVSLDYPQLFVLFDEVLGFPWRL